MAPAYNAMVGFVEEEVKKMMYELKLNKKFNEDRFMKTLKEYYNGYLFSEYGTERVYNSNMVLYFYNQILKLGKYPKNLMDENIKTDYKKLEDIAFNFKDDKTIEKILSGEKLTTKIVEKFNLEKMYNEKANFISLLYYFGMLTIEETIFDQYILKVPNYAVNTVYWDYFNHKLKKRINIDINNTDLTSAI
ncbi:MAG: AAA family ATPase [Marinisporobacter sp.]|jgi:hypothetical protein|nr:AAA family ATPase [Marinisporobacter sp.]